jgi:hypothetical protein
MEQVQLQARKTSLRELDTVFVAGVWIEIGKGTNGSCPAKRKPPG